MNFSSINVFQLPKLDSKSWLFSTRIPLADAISHRAGAISKGEHAPVIAL